MAQSVFSPHNTASVSSFSFPCSPGNNIKNMTPDFRCNPWIFFPPPFVREHTDTDTSYKHTNPKCCSQAGERQGLIEMMHGASGVTSGHDCLPCQLPWPWQPSATEPQQQQGRERVMERKRSSRQYFHVLEFITTLPLAAICAAKLLPPGRETGDSSIFSLQKRFSAGQQHYLSCRMV